MTPEQLESVRELVRCFFRYNNTQHFGDALTALLAEVERLRAILAYIDIHAPLADATCAEPGITLSEAARRALAE